MATSSHDEPRPALVGDERDRLVASDPRSTALAIVLCVALGLGYAYYSWRIRHIPFDSPLHQACYAGDLNRASALIARGADVNLQGPINNGDTPLMLAIASNKNRSRMIDLLLAHGARVNAGDKSGRTTLDIAILYGDIPAVQLLLQHGAQINAPDKEGHTPLSYAGVWTMNKPMKNFLIAHGAH